MAAQDSDAPKTIPQVATELWELSAAYAKQETIDPLTGLAQFLRNGLAGALVLGVGTLLLLLALLRFLQTETGSTFTGNLTWVPYVIVVLAACAVLGLAVWRIVKRKGPGL